MYKFSNSSQEKLDTVHPGLQLLMNVTLRTGIFDLTVIEGIRSKSRQKALFDMGLSKTMKSKHLTGDAIDIGIYKNGKLDFEDTKAYYVLAGIIFMEAKRLGIAIRWGGDWNRNKNFNDQSFNDLLHWELIA